MLKNPQSLRGWICFHLQVQREEGRIYSDRSIRKLVSIPEHNLKLLISLISIPEHIIELLTPLFNP
jgi:hypothetical protein